MTDPPRPQLNFILVLASHLDLRGDLTDEGDLAETRASLFKQLEQHRPPDLAEVLERTLHAVGRSVANRIAAFEVAVALKNAGYLQALRAY